MVIKKETFHYGGPHKKEKICIIILYCQGIFLKWPIFYQHILLRHVIWSKSEYLVDLQYHYWLWIFSHPLYQRPIRQKVQKF